MLNIMKPFLLALSLLLFTGVAFAQDDDDDDGVRYIYATYMYCNTAGLEAADAFVKNDLAPAYDAAVKAGEIDSWSWMAHHTGGKWRRLIYYTAPSIADLFDGGDAVEARVDALGAGENLTLANACPTHEDYIWQTIPGTGGSAPGEQQGNAGLSTYFKCNSSKEERADEIVLKTLGPIHQKQVEAGNLTSWGWIQHNIGGDYRRVLTLRAKDHKTLIKTRDAIYEEITNKRNKKQTNEFDSICGPHWDYLWDVQLASP